MGGLCEGLVGESETAEVGTGYFWEVDGTRRVVMSCRVTLSRGKKLFCEKERVWILRYLKFGYFSIGR